MGFHSLFILLLFVPLFFLISFMPWRRIRNGLLLIISLIFCMWAEPQAFLLVIAMSVLTFGIGLFIGRAIEKEKSPKTWKLIGVGLHLAVLAGLKSAVAADVFPGMPTGYSFFTFIAISYLLDVQRRKVPAEKSIFKFSNYLFYFPRYIAGPLSRWKVFESESQEPNLTLQNKVKGLERFIIGLGKKVLIADVLGEWLGMGVFEQQIPLVTSGTAWVMLLFYAVQLYYDFAGYTDMAIGLSQIFGISLPENFNLPYIAESLTDFWRRWHITLSAWFREYVFIPLEWQRRKKRWLKQWMNTLIIFLLTGLWHGLTPNFIIWGLMHGGMIVLETDKKIGRKIKALAKPWKHIYTLLVVLISWVFFKSPSFEYALHWLKALIGFGEPVNRVGFSVLPTIGSTVWLAFILGVVIAAGIIPKLWKKIKVHDVDKYQKGAVWAERSAYVVLLFLCILMLSTTSVLPAIYGGF
ncbi:MAG: hypothetical protein K8R40_13120 [Anaerolineaceae bacterium]|nr:hypothetical protein [Anaerolineaceae bacterium]